MLFEYSAVSGGAEHGSGDEMSERFLDRPSYVRTYVHVRT